MRDIIPGLRSNRGNAMIEFALIAPLLLTMVAGVIDYGMAIYSKMRLTSAVRSGVQYALAKCAGEPHQQHRHHRGDHERDEPHRHCRGYPSPDLRMYRYLVDQLQLGTCRDGSTKRYFLTIAAHYAFSSLFPAVSVIPSPLSTTTIIRTK